MKRAAARFAAHWLPVFSYCLLIFLQSARPSPVRMAVLPHADKLFHFAGYALLGGLVFRAVMASSQRIPPARMTAVSILLCSLYGLSDELHQSLVPYRDADPLDLLADVLGSAAGVLAFRAWKGPAHRRKIPD